MSIINFRPDDSGVQSLKKENITSPSNPALYGLTATARLQPTSEHPHAPPQAPFLPNYTGPERRRGERRQAQQQVILDTRDKRERRREADDQTGSAEDSPRVGIDVYG